MARRYKWTFADIAAMTPAQQAAAFKDDGDTDTLEFDSVAEAMAYIARAKQQCPTPK